MDEESPLAKVLVYQHMGFLLMIVLTWLDELRALPALIYGDNSFVFDFRQAALKMLVVLAVWFLMIGSTRRILTRVRYLEGFMRVCSWCRHIDYKGDWISMEEFLEKSFDTPTTHGICPTCLAEQAARLQARPATDSPDTDSEATLATTAPLKPNSETEMRTAGQARVAQASQPAGSRVPKPATKGTVRGATNGERSADWEVGDTAAGLETCAPNSRGPISEFGFRGSLRD